jgi:hypothetical protein
MHGCVAALLRSCLAAGQRERQKSNPDFFAARCLNLTTGG